MRKPLLPLTVGYRRRPQPTVGGWLLSSFSGFFGIGAMVFVHATACSVVLKVHQFGVETRAGEPFLNLIALNSHLRGRVEPVRERGSPHRHANHR